MVGAVVVHPETCTLEHTVLRAVGRKVVGGVGVSTCTLPHATVKGLI